MMEIEVSEETKKEILKLISTPGVQIEDIVEKVKLDYDTIMNFLSEEYLKHNFDYGRRLCCRF
ncbi:unnamed protein product [marine sediment metagenome]|uniref:Uncharacterized protein n=1 Tax=marine sediment metagenome TaxID=412755 RepID=X1B4Q5_9ZZZZ